MLTKNELAERISETGAGDKNHVKAVLDGLAQVVHEELAAGESITIPAIAKLHWKYTPPFKKGEKYKTGDTVKSPQGERVAEEDSPASKQRIRLGFYGTTATNNIKKDASAQRKAIKKAKK